MDGEERLHCRLLDKRRGLLSLKDIVQKLLKILGMLLDAKVVGHFRIFPLFIS